MAMEDHHKRGNHPAGEIALALGGGGMKGLAHIGVLKVLEREGFRIGAIAGTSAGGLIGAVYAAGYRPDEIEDILSNIDQTKMFGRRPNDGPSILGLAGLTRLLAELLGERTFADLSVPLAVTAVDARSGQEIIVHNGNLVDAVLATAAVPGVFPPVTIGNITLMDGGVLDPVPVSISRWLAPTLPVVAVSLNAPPEKWAELPPFYKLPIHIPGPPPIVERFSRLRLARAFNLFVQSVEYSSRLLSELRLQIERPEVLIRPDVAMVGWLDRVDVHQVVAAGEEAARKALPDIRASLSWSNRIGRRLRRSFTPQANPVSLVAPVSHALGDPQEADIDEP